MAYRDLIPKIYREIETKLDSIEERFMLQARKNIRNKKRNKNKKKYKGETNIGAGFGAYQKPKVEILNYVAMPNVPIFFPAIFSYFQLERE
jgi:hypothetical protein